MIQKLIFKQKKGGLYKLTEAPQGTNSVQSIMNATKQQVTSRDILVQLARANVKVNLANFLELFFFNFFLFYKDQLSTASVVDAHSKTAFIKSNENSHRHSAFCP